MHNFTTYWVPAEGADLDALRALHHLTFPGNELSIVAGWVKVAVKEGEAVPPGATTEKPPIPPSTMSGVLP